MQYLDACLSKYFTMTYLQKNFKIMILSKLPASEVECRNFIAKFISPNIDSKPNFTRGEEGRKGKFPPLLVL